MDYFHVLNLSKEPFSNSPDPDFFFQSEQHLECMQKIELSIRLRKGLTVIIGDVGTGKTTLCRQIIRRFSEDESIETHLILDPGFSTNTEFLRAMARTFWKLNAKQEISDWRLKELIKKYIFRQGMDNKKIVVLIIDEGQKIPGFCLESLREFLNYETNEYKLLQIIIFAQNEFEETLKDNRNFADRVNMYHHLGPLNFKETRSLIRFRVERASDVNPALSFFTFPALWAIYRASHGYPRKIINLCHKIILNLIIKDRDRAGWMMVHSSERWSSPDGSARRWRTAWKGALMALILMLIPLALGLDREHGRMYYNVDRGVMAKTPETTEQMQIPNADKKSDEIINEAPEKTGSEDSPVSKETTSVPDQLIQTSSPAIIKAPASYPEFMGQISIGSNETLGIMIHNIYGHFNEYNLGMVTRANPRMANPDRLVSGQEISFPAIPVGMERPPNGYWWVEVTRKETLKEAYAYLRDYPVDRPPIRIIPCWNPGDGMVFVLINKQVFNSEDRAREFLEDRNSKGDIPARLLSDWGSGTVFFSNPLS
jgi:general secretion pathway protein A